MERMIEREEEGKKESSGKWKKKALGEEAEGNGGRMREKKGSVGKWKKEAGERERREIKG